jgi:hypothetical protein
VHNKASLCALLDEGRKDYRRHRSPPVPMAES